MKAIRTKAILFVACVGSIVFATTSKAISDNNTLYVYTCRCSSEYHSKENCEQLMKCSGNVREVELTEVCNDKTPCQSCHNSY